MFKFGVGLVGILLTNCLISQVLGFFDMFCSLYIGKAFIEAFEECLLNVNVLECK